MLGKQYLDGNRRIERRSRLEYLRRRINKVLFEADDLFGHRSMYRLEEAMDQLDDDIDKLNGF